MVQVPVADGGDGTLDAALGGRLSSGSRCAADGPTGEPVDTAFAVRDGVAVVEMADVSGCGCCPPGGSRRWTASSSAPARSCGRLSTPAATRSCSGSAAAPAPTAAPGMLQALGAGSSTPPAAELPRGGAALAALDRLDLSGLHPRLAQAPRWWSPATSTTRCSGRTGRGRGLRAAEGREPAGRRAARRCAAPLGRRRRRRRAFGRSSDGARRDRPGAGAAGGVGFGAMAVLDGELEPGIGLVLDLVRFADHLPGARLVITGEGSLDEQTLSGKAPAGVATAATAAGVPVVTVSGRLALSQDQLKAAGVRQAYALTDIEPEVQRCISDAGPLLETLARKLARDWLSDPVPTSAPRGTSRS